MPEPMKFNAYIVSLVFGDKIIVNAWVAEKPEIASAAIVHAAMRQIPDLPPLSGIAMELLNPDFLRRALRAIETGMAPDQSAALTVLHGGKENEAPPEPEGPLLRGDGRCTAHNIILCRECMQKSDAFKLGASLGRLVPCDPAPEPAA